MEQNSDRPMDREDSQSRGKGSPAAALAGGRLTRSRARELGLKLEMAASPELRGRKGKKLQRRMEEGPKELGGRKGEKLLRRIEKLEDEGDCVQSTAAGGRCGSLASTIRDPRLETNRTSNLERRSNAQASSVKDLPDGAAPWLVHISSTSPDGKEILQYSGTVIHCDKEKAWVKLKILKFLGKREMHSFWDGGSTSYRVVFCALNDSMYDPLPKLAVHVPKATHLPNNGIYEGNMVFFSEHYRLAVLEIEGEMNFELKNVAPYGTNPSYGDMVSTLARDENMSLKLCCGTIKFLEEDHFMFPNYKLCPCGIGGPVINHAGDIVGMTCDDDGCDPVILRITTIHKCIEMWKFGRILRPKLGMCFRTVDLLDLGLQDCLRYKYGVNNGFIVDEVIINSAAERRGIRRGDVITSFHGKSCYLPEFEDFLLSVGMDSLKGLKQVDDFKLEVHNLLQRAKRTIFLPVEFSDGSEY